MILKNRNISSKIKRSKVTDYAALRDEKSYATSNTFQNEMHSDNIFTYFETLALPVVPAHMNLVLNAHAQQPAMYPMLMYCLDGVIM